MDEVVACQSMILLIPEIQSTVLERGCRRPVTMEDSRKLYPSSVRRSVSSCQGERGVVFWILRVDLCPPQYGRTIVNFKLPSSTLPLRVASFTSDTDNLQHVTQLSLADSQQYRWVQQNKEIGNMETHSSCCVQGSLGFGAATGPPRIRRTACRRLSTTGCRAVTRMAGPSTARTPPAAAPTAARATGAERTGRCAS